MRTIFRQKNNKSFGYMNPESKCFVAGHRGLVGSALCRNLEKRGFINILTRSREDLDLCDPVVTDAFFAGRVVRMRCTEQK